MAAALALGPAEEGSFQDGPEIAIKALDCRLVAVNHGLSEGMISRKVMGICRGGWLVHHVTNGWMPRYPPERQDVFSGHPPARSGPDGRNSLARGRQPHDGNDAVPTAMQPLKVMSVVPAQIAPADRFASPIAHASCTRPCSGARDEGCLKTHGEGAVRGGVVPWEIVEALGSGEWMFLLLQIGAFQIGCNGPFHLASATRPCQSRYVPGGLLTLHVLSESCYGVVPLRPVSVRCLPLTVNGHCPEAPVRLPPEEVADAWWERGG